MCQPSFRPHPSPEQLHILPGPWEKEERDEQELGLCQGGQRGEKHTKTTGKKPLCILRKCLQWINELRNHMLAAPGRRPAPVCVFPPRISLPMAKVSTNRDTILSSQLGLEPFKVPPSP